MHAALQEILTLYDTSGIWHLRRPLWKFGANMIEIFYLKFHCFLLIFFFFKTFFIKENQSRDWCSSLTALRDFCTMDGLMHSFIFSALGQLLGNMGLDVLCSRKTWFYTHHLPSSLPETTVCYSFGRNVPTEQHAGNKNMLQLHNSYFEESGLK